MTREQCKALLPVLQQWAEGKELQINLGDAAGPLWTKCGDNPSFIHEASDYRIKPQPRSVWLVEDFPGTTFAGRYPFTSKEEAEKYRAGKPVIEFREVL